MLFIKRISSLQHAYHWAGKLLPWMIAVVATLFAFGLVWSLYLAPPDYEQGEAYRIIYVHVPAAWMSLFVYVLMAGFGFIALVWRIKLAELICVESAALGASFTATALVTGMLWGKPMWGTYWVWDARLTSELVLLFLYFGVIVLHAAIPNPRQAARAAALLAVVGVVNVPIIHYSVEWWATLHQGPTVTRFDKPAAHPSMLFPLLFMTCGFMLYYFTALAARLRNAIVLRDRGSRWMDQLRP